MASSVDRSVLSDVAAGLHSEPHDVLGPHPGPDGVAIRVLRPLATSVAIETLEGRFDAKRLVDGLWEAIVPGVEAPDYRVHVSCDGKPTREDDPYRFLPTLTDVDIRTLREGRHERMWDVLGANVVFYPSALGEVAGTAFAVWAPHARVVRVVGDFNGWNGVAHTMRNLASSGAWELFVPGVGAGERYKFEILGRDGSWTMKADPLARATEVPSNTASIVSDSGYEWGDGEWMAARATRDPRHEPMSVYEVHLGSWRHGLTYRELAKELTAYVAETGFTHVEFLPVAEHPFGPSWGYQVTSYFAPTSRLGSPDDFRFLVDSLHRAGIGVIIDWVPGHFPKDDWALAKFDGAPLFEHADPLRAEQPDWGTLVFDFGRPFVRNFLVSNAVYWLSEFHADGLRVDAVASMLYLDYSRGPGHWRPNVHGGRENLEAIALLQEVNATTTRLCPGTTVIAEESTAWPGVTAGTGGGGLGFSLKWNMGWMNDTLRYLGEDFDQRPRTHGAITFSMMYAFSEHFLLPLSHDEVVHGKGSLWGKMPGDEWRKAAGLRALLAYQWTHPGKQLLFMGGEFGQVSEWADARSLDWDLLDEPLHAGVSQLVRDLNALYSGSPALWARDSEPAGFEWIDQDDAAHATLAFLRRDGDGGDELAVVCNFSVDPREEYRLALPASGAWDEVLNTDAEKYGGSGVENLLDRVVAEPAPHLGREASAPLGVVVFRRAT
jgi:1,4-alpha-glucan branching enzyme